MARHQRGVPGPSRVGFSAASFSLATSATLSCDGHISQCINVDRVGPSSAIYVFSIAIQR